MDVPDLDGLTDHQLGKARPGEILAAMARERLAVFRPGLLEQLAAATGPRRRVIIGMARKCKRQPKPSKDKR